MKIAEIITDTDGTLSHTKSSAVLANVAATIAFLHHSFTYELTPEMLVVYVGAVGLQRFGSKFLDNHKVETK